MSVAKQTDPFRRRDQYRLDRRKRTGNGLVGQAIHEIDVDRADVRGAAALPGRTERDAADPRSRGSSCSVCRIPAGPSGTCQARSAPTPWLLRRPNPGSANPLRAPAHPTEFPEWWASVLFGAPEHCRHPLARRRSCNRRLPRESPGPLHTNRVRPWRCDLGVATDSLILGHGKSVRPSSSCRHYFRHFPAILESPVRQRLHSTMSRLT